MIVSFHLQRFYIWILIFHHQPIRPPSHQRGRDPPVMAGADSRFYCHCATAATTQGTRSETESFLAVLQNSGNNGFRRCLLASQVVLRGLLAAPGASRSLTTANTPGKAARGQQLTVSLKQHSHTKYEKLATNGGAIGTRQHGHCGAGDWARPQEQWIRCQTGRPGAKTCLIFTQQ